MSDWIVNPPGPGPIHTLDPQALRIAEAAATKLTELGYRVKWLICKRFAQDDEDGDAIHSLVAVDAPNAMGGFIGVDIHGAGDGWDEAEEPALAAKLVEKVTSRFSPDEVDHE